MAFFSGATPRQRSDTLWTALAVAACLAVLLIVVPYAAFSDGGSGSAGGDGDAGGVSDTTNNDQNLTYGGGGDYYGGMPSSESNSCPAGNANTFVGQSCTYNGENLDCTNIYQCVAMPDLTAGGVSAHGSLIAGRTLHFSGAVQNIGAAAAGAFNTVFQFDRGDDTINSWTNLAGGSVASLASGSSRNVQSANWTNIPAGTHAVRLCADLPPNWTGQVVELNENNNCGGALMITVTEQQEPPDEPDDPGTGTGTTTEPPRPTCEASYYCSGSNLYYTNAACQNALVQSCSYMCSAGACVAPRAITFVPFTATIPAEYGGGTFAATGHLQARPTLIRADRTTQLYWNVSNVSSCTVTGTNGDSWTGESSGAAGQTSGAISVRTTFTLTCTALSGATPPTITESVIINVVPTFRET